MSPNPHPAAPPDLDAYCDAAAALLGLTIEPAWRAPVLANLRVLREAGLVRVRVAGQHRVYRLDPAPLAEVDAWVDRYRRHWDGALDRLAQHLTDERDRP